MSTRFATLALVCIVGLAALPGVHADTSFTGALSGTASVWASFYGTTCSNWQSASFSGVFVQGNIQYGSSSNSQFSISISQGELTYTSSASWPCGSQSMPILSTDVNCSAGTARIDAGVPGSVGVTFLLTGATCA